MPDVSIAVSAKDNFSTAIQKMQQKVTPFRKDIELLQRELDDLSRNKVDLKVEVDAARVELRAAKRAFQEVAEEAETSQRRIDAATRLDTARANLDRATQNYQLVSQHVRQTERDIRNLGGTLAKQENTNRDFVSSLFGNNETLNKLAQAGVMQLGGQALGQAAQFLTMSALGKPDATLLGSAVSGAVSGAAMGSVAGPWGAAIGGGIGLVSGALSGYVSNESEKDDGFRSYVQSAYQGALEQESQTLSSGSSIAAQREIDLMAFRTLFGDQTVAESFLSDLLAMSARTPFEYDDLTGLSRVLKTYGYDRDHILPTLSAIGDAGAALGLSVADLGEVATGIGRMNATGKTTLEYINPLQERGIDAIGALGAHFGVDQGTVYEMISGGEISGQEAARVILQALIDSFGGAMADQSQTFSGLESSLRDAQANLDAAMGEGYNETRKDDMQAQLDFLNGETGVEMQEAYSMIGEWKASLENTKNEILRDTMTGVMQGVIPDLGNPEIQEQIAALHEEYAALSEQAMTGTEEEQEAARAEMGRVLAEAQVLAQNAYLENEAYDLEIQAHLDLIAGIQEASVTAWEKLGREEMLALSRGRFSVEIGVPPGVYPASSYLSGETYDSGTTLASSYAAAAGRHAFGLERVPYDNYPALLHEGERVLTANEVRQRDQSAGQILITGNYFTVREEADVDAVAREIVRRLTIQRAAAMP